MAKTLTGLTPDQERMFQVRETEVLARQMERGLAREIMGAMRRFAEAQGSPGRQAEVLAAHKDAVGARLGLYYGRAFDLFGQRVLTAGAKAHPGRWHTKDAQDDFDAIRQAWIAQNVAHRVTPIANTTKRQATTIIQAAIAEAVAEGLGQAATGDLIRRAIGRQGAPLARSRARVIARTETHSSANAAAHEAARATGLPMLKEWVADRSPDRTREDHQDADGQQRQLNEPFLVGDEELMYPGDPNGSAANIINCRCAEVFVVE